MSEGRPCSEQRDAAKMTNSENEGLLVARGAVRAGGGGVKQRVITGGKQDCLADSISYATGDEPVSVRTFFGVDRSFHRAQTYVTEKHPALALDDVSGELLQTPDGVEYALLNKNEGRFIVQQKYTVDGVRKFHCAYFDAGKPWRREDHELGWLTGYGWMMDNQSDVPFHLATTSDRNSITAAREFFAAPYPKQPDMRITRVYELVPIEVAKARAMERDAQRALKRKRDCDVAMLRCCAACKKKMELSHFSKSQCRKGAAAQCVACVAQRK